MHAIVVSTSRHTQIHSHSYFARPFVITFHEVGFVVFAGPVSTAKNPKIGVILYLTEALPDRRHMIKKNLNHALELISSRAFDRLLGRLTIHIRLRISGDDRVSESVTPLLPLPAGRG